MQVYFRLDRELEQWYEALPPHGRSEALNQVIRAGLDKYEGATKSDIARLESLIKNLRVITPPEILNEDLTKMPSMAIED